MKNASRIISTVLSSVKINIAFRSMPANVSCCGKAIFLQGTPIGHKSLEDRLSTLERFHMSIIRGYTQAMEDTTI